MVSRAAESGGGGAPTHLPRFLDVYPFNSPWVNQTVRTGFRRWGLPFWFALNTIPMVWHFVLAQGSFGFDLRLYRMAADAWLSGQNPWVPTLEWDRVQTFNYAGPPPTLLPTILLDWVPIDVLVLVFALVLGVVAIWTLHRIGLPLWWMLFPPIVAGIWVENLNIIVIALLVSGSMLAGGIAIVLKIYAALPLVLLGRWRALVIAAVFVVVTFPILPWSEFLKEYSQISALLTDQAWGGQTSVLTSPLATLGAGIGLILLGRERAAWLAVPALWPATQLHYTVLALPALSPALAAFAAVNYPGFVGLGVMCCALWERRVVIRSMVDRMRGRIERQMGRARPTQHADTP